jgi:hypothetical protein
MGSGGGSNRDTPLDDAGTPAAGDGGAVTEMDAGAPQPPQGCDSIAGKEYEDGNNRFWVADCIKVVRGVIVTPEFASHAGVWKDETLRKTAARNALGILRVAPGCWYCAANSYDGLKTYSDELIDKTLPRLATQSSHPELNETGLIVEGLSASSWNVAGLFIHHPERLIAGIPVAGGFDGWVFGKMTGASWKVPLTTVNQGEDGFYPGEDVGTEEDVVKGRSEKLAPWSHFVALGCGHDSWCKMDWVNVWIEEIAKVRIAAVITLTGKQVPRDIDQSQGWLGRYSADANVAAGGRGSNWKVKSAEVWPYNEAPCAKKDCLWFPSKRAAETWQYAMTHEGKVP